MSSNALEAVLRPVTDAVKGIYPKATRKTLKPQHIGVYRQTRAIVI